MINPKNSNFSDKKNTVNDEQRAFYRKMDT